MKVTTMTRKSELYTFAGLVGYCSKDMEEPHFKSVHKGVSIELLQRGRVATSTWHLAPEVRTLH